jgi:hypothetical protein
MLPVFYQTHLEKYLSQAQMITLKLLVWLLQSQKQVKIERLAATLPLPIQQNSRRRHIQRFLNLTRLSVVILWFPLIQEIVSRRITSGKQLIIALDRTQWQENNILMASAIYQKRAFPIFWMILAKKGFGRFNLAVYWKRKYKTKTEKEPWYLLTNFDDLETAVKVYQKRFGIEAMFKDCKTGGYNLEGSKASPQRLVRLVLLIALAMTIAWLQAEKTNILGKSSYICRRKETGRTRRRHSNFWIGLYGHNWIVAFHECHEWVQELIDCLSNKRTFYQRGLRAITLIQQAL